MTTAFDTVQLSISSQEATFCQVIQLISLHVLSVILHFLHRNLVHTGPSLHRRLAQRRNISNTMLLE